MFRKYADSLARHLGRSVSLSPVEVAKAFNAPLLVEVDSNAEVKKIVEQIGVTRVRYGAVSSSSTRAGGKHDGYVQVHQVVQNQDRLEIADPSSVRPLQ